MLLCLFILNQTDEEVAAAAEEQDGVREVVLEAPITEEKIRELKVGDVVIINGMMHTGRDAILMKQPQGH